MNRSLHLSTIFALAAIVGFAPTPALATLQPVDLELDVEVEPAGVSGNYRVIFTVQNNSDSVTAENVAVSITMMPEGADPVGYSATGGTVFETETGFFWSLQSLKDGFDRTVTVVVSDPVGPLDITGEVSSDSPDPDPSNNVAGTTVEGEGSTGEEGGLESNGRLSQLIARRDLLRKLDRVDKLGTASLKLATATGIEAYVPASGSWGEGVETTPVDLVGATNAYGVFGMDYLDAGGRRTGAVLALVTQDGPYEHTKTICDRLKGSTLDFVRSVKINGFDLLMSKLRRPDGGSDYAISFAVGAEGLPYQLDGRWDAVSRPAFERGQVYNFQVWGANPQIASSIAAELLGRLPETVQATDTKAPAVYVTGGRYRSGVIYLELERLDPQVQEVTVRGSLSRSEIGEREEFSKVMPYRDNLAVPVGPIFDFNFFVNDDLVYLSDGVWTHWSGEPFGRIDSFAVLAEQSAPSPREFALERGFTVSGSVTNYVNLVRHLAPGMQPIDLSGYDFLEFTASGAVRLEVALIKAGVDSFANQPRRILNLDGQGQTYRIRLSDFGDGFTFGDVQTLALNPLGDNVTSQRFELRVEDVRFGSDPSSSTGTTPIRLRSSR